MPLTFEQKSSAMETIRVEVIRLKQSSLYTYRVEHTYVPVIGEGSVDASIMCVGEAPGKKEAETGRPFCGRSGKFLDEMLESVHLNRKDTYITSIVKDRPQDNRDPSAEEIALYAPFLDRQIEIIQPKVIVTLGRFSMIYIMNTCGLADELKPIGQIHGQEFKTMTDYGEIVVVPLYHPAVALYKGSNRKILLDDFQIVKKYI